MQFSRNVIFVSVSITRYRPGSQRANRAVTPVGTYVPFALTLSA